MWCIFHNKKALYPLHIFGHSLLFAPYSQIFLHMGKKIAYQRTNKRSCGVKVCRYSVSGETREKHAHLTDYLPDTGRCKQNDVHGRCGDAAEHLDLNAYCAGVSGDILTLKKKAGKRGEKAFHFVVHFWFLCPTAGKKKNGWKPRPESQGRYFRDGRILNSQIN